MEYPIYHPTLHQAIDAAFKHAVNSRAAIALVDLQDEFSQGVPYGETVQGHCVISELKGKPTKKFFHATIYRMSDTGTYELTCYIL